MNSPAALAPDLAGSVLEGAYRLVRLIGQGGMGAVYEAIQLRLQKRVAIKLMAPSEMSDLVSLARFYREAEITSKLGHPHLVNVVDFGTAESGQPYLVMEYLEGEDLDQRLRRPERLSPDTVARIVVQTASALGAAHTQDVVHRDLKPANIFLLRVPGEPEFVKVLDFGISKIKAANARRLTNVHSVVGTPLYMSPEQAMGRTDDTDHRADQWALACIAWEMLCGHPPFVADDTSAVLYQITRIDPPSLAREVPALPAGVEEVLRSALSKRHLDRYPSIREFARAFELALLGYPTELTPPLGILFVPDKPLPTPVPAVARVDAPARDRVSQTRLPSPVGDGSPEPRLAVATTRVARSRGWRRHALVAVGIVTVALVVLGLSRSRSPVARKAVPSSLAPVATRADVVALPPLPTAATESATATTIPDPSAAAGPLASSGATPRKVAKPKIVRDLDLRGRSASRPKKANARPKHRLFEEL
jgi:eukaryotic-like serine/threonine-protein kinase